MDGCDATLRQIGDTPMPLDSLTHTEDMFRKDIRDET